MLSSCNQATFKCSHLGWVDEELETQGRRGEGEGEFCPHFDGGGGGGREDGGGSGGGVQLDILREICYRFSTKPSPTES